ncbi:putative sporulation protein YyaC [Desulfosporosinus orientis DSM 765]|uniref:Putative sporulation protein YyaC n=1 Tax=Desulfosporosinus orientis (strain ATCC 19365 / DSM 765 / NCIMB 8382 / VKM B-1628 / Singapore I) TaxID=768706 RepID=G7WI71_DESOD|nr:spore protease YyaC [Desulfosporosinus orientis]AET70994.1 putative sporulation protein YyaC [Desulfosporosinus orientis DSM 765]
MSLFSLLTETQKIKAHMDDYAAKAKLEERLFELLISTQNRPVVILCIGTDRSTGDALGPLIGTLLSRLKLPHLHIYGTLDDPVHATNLEQYISVIQHSFYNPFIIAIDACLGRLDSIGCITLADGPLRPGAGVNKKLPEIGEAHITGIVNVGGFMEFMVLQNTRLNLVWRMSENISSIITRSYMKVHLNK